MMRRILPFLFVCYVVSYLDRVNVGFAALTMNKDIGLTATSFGIGAGLFFFGYFIAEIPSNLIMMRVGARIWIARIMISWGLVSAATAFVTGPVQFGIARFLLGLGEDVARSLGTNVVAARTVGIVAITLLTGAATAACGPIAFVGLVVPHVARAITGPDYRWLLPYAGLLGGVMLVMADVVGRIVVRPGELQVGIVLALMGAPFFIALVRRRRLVAL